MGKKLFIALIDFCLCILENMIVYNVIMMMRENVGKIINVLIGNEA